MAAQNPPSRRLHPHSGSEAPIDANAETHGPGLGPEIDPALDPAPLRFVHCADLHLDSPFDGAMGFLESADPALASGLREATFTAWSNIVDLAIDRKVDALLVAGDVFDVEERSLRAQLLFREGLERAARAGVACFIAHGNHDSLSGWQVDLDLPKSVHRFGAQIESVAIRRGDQTLGHVVGMSYAERRFDTNPAPLYGDAARGLDSPYSIGLLHTDLTPHSPYAPCTADDLGAQPIDYWALGHRHGYQRLRDQPAMVYPGTSQGRNRREIGPRGCCLVTVRSTSSGTSRPSPTIEWIPTDAVRWQAATLDIAALTTIDQLLDRLQAAVHQAAEKGDGRPTLVTIDLVGRGPLHSILRRIDLDRDLVQPANHMARSARHIPVVVIEVRATTASNLDRSAMRERGGLVSEIIETVDRLRSAESSETQSSTTLRPMLAQSFDLSVVGPYLDRIDEARWTALLDRAETLALDLLVPETTNGEDADG